jgi:hypothetical protein
MSHGQRGDATHTKSRQSKYRDSFLGTKKCGGIDRIDVTVDVHVEVSHVNGFWCNSVKNHAKCTDVIKKEQI